MPRVLWLHSSHESAAIQALEQKIGLKVAAVAGPPSTWKSIAHRIQAILIELPVDSAILLETLAEAHKTALPLPVVIYDKDCLLDESLVQPTMMFRHITRSMTPEEIGDVVGALIEETAQNLGGPTEPWQDLLIGDSRPMRELHSMIRLVSPRRSTVLITGETGTGKEMVARAIHMASKRAASDLVPVNCAAIPENLVEAELFGHAKGAFTGAVNHRVGRFEQAHRGTILLDEVGELPLEIQPKLLRVLQEREFQRVGSSETVQTDARVIAATNIDLEEAVEQRSFRQDLLYRLSVVPIHVPPLRERAGDIPLLVDHFVEKVCRREALRPKTVSPAALERLIDYEWPGNVRELEHVIERAVTLAGSRDRLYLGDIHVTRVSRVSRVTEANSAAPAARGVTEMAMSGLTSMNFEEVIGQVERLLIQEALRKCDGNKAKAARILGLKRTTMLYKSKSLEACA